MKIELKKDVFYLFEGSTKILSDSVEELVNELKEIVRRGENVDPEALAIYEVDTSGKEWSIKQVPWSRIAISLMKGGE